MQNYSERVISTAENYVLEGLQPDELYNIWVIAKIHEGDGPRSDKISVRTQQFGESIIMYSLSVISHREKSLVIIN